MSIEQRGIAAGLLLSRKRYLRIVESQKPNRSLAMKLSISVAPFWRSPSVVVPSEFNFLLNPEHADFRRIVIGIPRAVEWDPRLIALLNKRS